MQRGGPGVKRERVVSSLKLVVLFCRIVREGEALGSNYATSDKNKAKQFNFHFLRLWHNTELFMLHYLKLQPCKSGTLITKRRLRQTLNAQQREQVMPPWGAGSVRWDTVSPRGPWNQHLEPEALPAPWESYAVGGSSEDMRQLSRAAHPMLWGTKSVINQNA